MLQGQPWKPFTLQFLTDYKSSTPHVITGIPTYKLLLGKKKRKKLHIIKQNKVKEYTDKHRSALQTNFQPGDKERVKKPG